MVHAYVKFCLYVLEAPWTGEGSVVLFMLHLTMWAAQTGWAPLTGQAGGRPPSTPEAGERGAGGTPVSYVWFCHFVIFHCLFGALEFFSLPVFLVWILHDTSFTFAFSYIYFSA